MRYFAYGSNMSLKRLTHRVPSARFVTVASLPAHQLRFHKEGRDGSAKCDAVSTSRAEDNVVGVIYDLAEAEKPILDRHEGVGNGYEEKTVTLITNAGEFISALTYCATRIDPSLKPFHWYREHVLRGALENGLPDSYTHAIAAIESIADPLPARHERELSIYD